jgi:hypothetical protein
LRILAHDKRGEGRAMAMMMTMGAFEKSPDDNQPLRHGRGRQPRCWARGESGVSWGVGGGITFGRSPNDNQPRLGESAATPGEGESATTLGWGGRQGRQTRERVFVVYVTIVVVVVMLSSLVRIPARRQQ